MAQPSLGSKKWKQKINYGKQPGAAMWNYIATEKMKKES